MSKQSGFSPFFRCRDVSKSVDAHRAGEQSHFPESRLERPLDERDGAGNDDLSARVHVSGDSAFANVHEVSAGRGLRWMIYLNYARFSNSCAEQLLLAPTP